VEGGEDGAASRDGTNTSLGNDGIPIIDGQRTALLKERVGGDAPDLPGYL